MAMKQTDFEALAINLVNLVFSFDCFCTVTFEHRNLLDQSRVISEMIGGVSFCDNQNPILWKGFQ